tara:strand:+ start:102 stop:365 length:264 start_codon:yes stop_codon:yes gene_type:complete
MTSINLRIEIPEILITCGTVLNLYDKNIASYVLLSIGLVFAFMRAAYNMHIREDEKKRKEKDVLELRQFLLKSATLHKSLPSGKLTH